MKHKTAQIIHPEFGQKSAALSRIERERLPKIEPLTDMPGSMTVETRERHNIANDLRAELEQASLELDESIIKGAIFTYRWKNNGKRESDPHLGEKTQRLSTAYQAALDYKYLDADPALIEKAEQLLQEVSGGPEHLAYY